MAQSDAVDSDAPPRPTSPTPALDAVPGPFELAGLTVGVDPLLIAGPCAIESAGQALRIARALAGRGVRVFRGGAFKPRSSPHSFQGLGLPGLEILRRVREQTGLLICTEATDVGCLDAVARVADVVQIGSRNMDNPALLKAAARCGRPVLLKRGFAATLDELLLAAEYLVVGGNPRVMLCERGIRSVGDHSRFTLDLHAVLALRRRTRLPLLVDPSHAAGRAADVAPLALAAAAVASDGWLIEVHDRPHEARCDGAQAISPTALAALQPALAGVAAAARTAREAGA